LSSPPIGRTIRGTTLSPGSAPQLCTAQRPATFSFPARSASARGSDLPRRASWPFGSHTLEVVHPTWGHRPCVTPGPISDPSSACSPLRTGPPHYRLQLGTTPAPWSADIAETFQDLLGTDKLGVTAVALLSNSLAPSTYASYDNALIQFFIFRTKEKIAPQLGRPTGLLRTTTHHVLRKILQATPLDAFWSFSPSEASADWGAASTVSSWLSLALLTVNTSAPAGFKWTSHNLRKGAPSAASCIGVPLPVIKYVGGWAKKSSVTERKYIDPTMTPTPAAWRFSGWLTPSPPPH
jgi:hypothetical protein